MRPAPSSSRGAASALAGAAPERRRGSRASPPPSPSGGGGPSSPAFEASARALALRRETAPASVRAAIASDLDEVACALEEERAQRACETREDAAASASTLASLSQLRAVLVEGIVKNTFVFGHGVGTTSLAVRLLDRFLGSGRFAVRATQGWIYHLVANACQLIAVKIQESDRVTSAELQRHLDVAFDGVAVSKMEALVLRELGWSVNDVVPHTFIPSMLGAMAFVPGTREHDEATRRCDVFALSVLYDAKFSAHARWPPSEIAAGIIAASLADAGLHRDAVVRDLCRRVAVGAREDRVRACAIELDAFREALGAARVNEHERR